MSLETTRRAKMAEKRKGGVKQPDSMKTIKSSKFTPGETPFSKKK